MEFLYQYGVFLAKVVTIVIAIIVIIASIAAQASKQARDSGELSIDSMSEKLDDLIQHAREKLLSKDQLKALKKEQKKQKKEHKEQDKENHLFVIDFKGSMDAHEVENLRKEVTAVLSIASEKDRVLVNVESGGGVVHGYGLAASQLQRIKDKGLELVVSVDKVAASGGYMMACVADKIIASRFAIIGSIGVIAQLPNFNKILKKNDIEFEQHTAGEFKRTLTMFGENNDAGRQKFREELEEVHVMFKGYVKDNRPDLDIDNVATGEYWYGERALALGLVDEIQTSDDFILKANEETKVFKVAYAAKKTVAEKLGLSVASGAEHVLMKLWERSQSIFK
ncbi:protease SohB [Alteromonas facilis]|uniref:protease SohB n=1 Tax=Alteromonas facilis TaxID=2048004 RepID=UPI000C2882A4|nr:protease SohB [Alteromonas facilis]